MPESKLYREKLYARYASAQVPDWLGEPSKSARINRNGHAHRLLRWLPVARNASILDLGCGSGELLTVLRSLGFNNLTGVGVGPEQVAIARTRGHSVVQADIVEYLRASDQSFDMIFAFDVIEHFTKDEVLDLLDFIWRRLKPGGKLIVQTPNAMSPWGYYLRYNDLTHELIFGPSCLASTLRLCGFKDMQFREVTPYVHGIASAVRWILWKLVKVGLITLNCIESGEFYSGAYTRNMLVCALKDQAAR